MPRNVYFSQAVKSEQHLYEDLIIESLGIYGQDVYYIPRTLINRDNVLNEDPASSFDDAYLLEMYIENTEGFDNDMIDEMVDDGYIYFDRDKNSN